MLKETLLKLLKIDSLIDDITGYVETRIELMKVELKEEVTKWLAKVLVLVAVMAVLTLFVLMISMAAAYKIGETTGTFVGFAIVGCFYLLIGLTILIFRNSIADKLEKRLKKRMKEKEK